MKFDPLTYALRRVDRNEDRIRLTEQATMQHEDLLRSHGARLDRLEARRQRLDALLRKCPYLVAPTAVIVANMTPKEIGGLIASLIKAL